MKVACMAGSLTNPFWIKCRQYLSPVLHFVIRSLGRWFDSGRQGFEDIFLRYSLDIGILRKCGCIQTLAKAFFQRGYVCDQPGFHALNHQEYICSRVLVDVY